MSIKFSVVGEALKRVLIDPSMDESGICQNLRIELEADDAVNEDDKRKMNAICCNEFGLILNTAIFGQWPEHHGDEHFPVGGSAEYYINRYDKWNDEPESGQKRRRLLKYSIQLCKENPDSELVI